MSWISIPKTKAYLWNDKLKNYNVSFNQFPYYISSEYNSRFSKSIFIKYVEDGKEIAYAAIIEIGMYPAKFGIIEGGPVLLTDGFDAKQIINSLKAFAVKKGYVHLQIKPPFNNQLCDVLKNDDAFIADKVFFPCHIKDDKDYNIYNKPEEELLAGFKLQCRRKIVLASRLPFVFRKATEKDSDDIRELFNAVSDTKGYKFLPFNIYEAIFKEGKKYNLCDWYLVYLNNKLVNAVFIVKDGQSFYHYTSAFLVKGYHINESPPAKLHLYIMQDCFYNEHKKYYNISFGGSDNLVRFKALFNPVAVEKPPYYTFVIKKNTLKFLEKFSGPYIDFFRNAMKSIDRLITAK